MLKINYQLNFPFMCLSWKGFLSSVIIFKMRGGFTLSKFQRVNCGSLKWSLNIVCGYNSTWNEVGYKIWSQNMVCTHNLENIIDK